MANTEAEKKDYDEGYSTAFPPREFDTSQLEGIHPDVQFGIVGDKLSELFSPLANNPPGTGLPLLNCGGFNMPAFMVSYYPWIRNFPIDEKDIIVASHPKSGTHWLYYNVYLIATGNFDTDLKENKIQLLEIPKPPTPSQYLKMSKMEPPRFFSTHLPATMLPRNANKCHIIYIYRNSKDVAVSLFNHVKSMSIARTEDSDPQVTFKYFCNSFINDMSPFGPYHKHLLSYDKLQKDWEGKNILLIRYEDLNRDQRGTIKKIAEFLGKELDEKMIDRIIEATSVEAMRKNDEFNWHPMREAGLWSKKVEFIRKGVIGDWKNELFDDELVKLFNDYVEKNLPEHLRAPDE